MRQVILIACCKRKLAHPAPAWQLYQSDLFRKSLAYAKSLAPDAIYILSAKHGLAELDKPIAPYDMTLRKMTTGQRRLWSERVLQELAEVARLSIVSCRTISAHADLSTKMRNR